jgi:hypothetical protein
MSAWTSRIAVERSDGMFSSCCFFACCSVVFLFCEDCERGWCARRGEGKVLLHPPFVSQHPPLSLLSAPPSYRILTVCRHVSL